MWRALASECGVLLAGFLLVTGALASTLHALAPSTSSLYITEGTLSIAAFSLVFAFGYCRVAPRDPRQVLASSLAVFSLSLAFFVLVPVTIERSVSVFLLQSMGNTPGHSFSKPELEAIFTTHYTCGRNAISKRMDEGHFFGTIQFEPDDHYALSPAGQGMADVLQPVARFFSVPKPPMEHCH